MSESENQLSLSEAGAPGAVTAFGKSGKQQPISPPVIAGFEILNKIGQGGMGAVFRARQISMDRIVALKILPKRLASEPQFKERFIREARLSAKLNHVNLINGIECGESGGYTYFAMEFVDGCTAKQLLDNQTRHFTHEEVLAIIRQIAEALQYAHSRSLIHRDVKPENIMVTSSGQAKLCDLGLARSLEESPNDAHLTQAGQAVGTPFYISPEQARGEKNLDARTDIYSLGATFYHLLTGQPPFLAPTAAAVMVKHLTEVAPAACEVADDVPPEFSMVVSKMMAKAAVDRYADVSALLRDLDALRDGKLPAAAEFRGKTSCALPPRTGIRMAPAGDVSRRVTSVGTARTKAKVQPSKKSSPVPLIAGSAAVIFIAFLALRGSGSQKPVEVADASPAAKPAPVPAVAPKPAPAPAAVKPAPVKPAPVSKQAPANVSNDAVAAILSQPRKSGDASDAAAPDTQPRTEPAAVKASEPVAAKTEPASVAKTETPAAATPAAPAVDSAAETAYLRFLVEITRRAANTNLSRLEKDARDLATKPDYIAGKEAIAAEMKDLENAVKFEAGALEEMGRRRKPLDLPADHVLRKFGSDIKIEEYDSSRGLMVTVGGARMPINSCTIPATTIVENAATRSGPQPAMYYFYRGERGEVQKLLAVMNPQDRPPIERKLELIKTGDVELAARSTYSILVGHIKAKQWKPFLEKLAAFEKNFSETSVAQEKMPELAAFKEFAEEITNPIGRIFNAKSAKLLPDGFVELAYDFTTPQQLAAFSCEHGDLSLQDGYMHVPAGGTEYAMAHFNAPIVELRHMEIVGKGPTSGRFGIAYIPPGITNLTDLNTAPKMIMRPYNRMAHLENWEGASGAGRARANAMGSVAQTWSKDTTYSLDVKAAGAVWNVGGEELAPVKLPASAVGGTFGFFGADGNHFWTAFKITFKPDPAWMAQQRKK